MTLKSLSQMQWILAGWLAVLVCIIGCSVAIGASLSTSLFLLAIGGVPAIVMVLVGNGVPPPTVAEILHAVEIKEGA